MSRAKGLCLFLSCSSSLIRSVLSWRVGYLISHPETVDAILNFHDPVYISVPILQHALATYLRDHLDDYVAHVALSNEIMQRNLAKLGPALAERFGWKFLRPQGSMYAMFRHHEASDLAAVLEALKVSKNRGFVLDFQSLGPGGRWRCRRRHVLRGHARQYGLHPHSRRPLGGARRRSPASHQTQMNEFWGRPR
jgi:hypothetical protein